MNALFSKDVGTDRRQQEQSVTFTCPYNQNLKFGVHHEALSPVHFNYKLRVFNLIKRNTKCILLLHFLLDIIIGILTLLFNRLLSANVFFEICFLCDRLHILDHIQNKFIFCHFRLDISKQRYLRFHCKELEHHMWLLCLA